MAKYKVGDKLMSRVKDSMSTMKILMVGNTNYFVDWISSSGYISEMCVNIQDLDIDENWKLYKEPRLVNPNYVMVLENTETGNLYFDTDTFDSEYEARQVFERWRSPIVKLHDVIEINYEETPK